MLYLIDGTGPSDYSDYHADMRRGFCWHLNTLNGANARYWRGPNELGLETWEIGDLVIADIAADRRANPALQIVLAGHSRGGAAVIYVARKLKEQGIEVRAMVLFDAVRRAIQTSPSAIVQRVLGASGPPELVYQAGLAGIELISDFMQFGNNAADVIPSNVKRALHVVRDERFSNYFIETREYRELQAARKAAPPIFTRGPRTDTKSRLA